MNAFDRGIAIFAPRYALKRAHARAVLASYEAAQPSKRYRKSRNGESGERHVVRDAAATRAIARDLERNHDLVRGALVTLTRNVVGATGISIEPTPRVGKPGSEDYDDIDDDFARELLNLWRDWTRRPEVTRTMGWVQLQEMACRSFLRDGEVFAQLVEGTGPAFRHASAVPLSIELLEADLVPLDFEDEAEGTHAGIRRNEWGEPLSYRVYKRHPGNGGWYDHLDLKSVPAERMLHVANRERSSGLRGISILASAINRLLDLKDYEESENLAARIAANIAAYVKRDKETDWTPPVPRPGDEGKPRELFLEAGAILDNLRPGEEIAMLNPDRPNNNLDKHRQSQLRAASRPTALSYSAFSGDYDGTYSAQRQELVESFEGYRMLTGLFVDLFVRPIWERFVALAIASGKLRVPSHIRRETVAQAEFRGPKMPWIKPTEEADAVVTMARAGIQSMTQSIAERGRRMQDVYEEIAREQRLADELGLTLESDARTPASAPRPQQDDDSLPRRDDQSVPTTTAARQRAPRLRAVDTGATR